MTTPARATMNRLDLTRRLVALLTHDEAVIAGIGNTNFDLLETGYRPQNFPMLGSMGLACSIALGVAVAQPQRRVIALEGDGSLLMNLGTLATIAAIGPTNLAVVCWDNGAYQITGDQPSATAAGVDLVGIARSAGFRRSAWSEDAADFTGLIEESLTHDGPHFIAARVDHAPGATARERDAVLIRDRFMRGIGVIID